MLEDEAMPFEMEGDEEFDGIMADLIALQEEQSEYQFSSRNRSTADWSATERQRRAEEEERRVVGGMADALATILAHGKSNTKDVARLYADCPVLSDLAEAKMEEGEFKDRLISRLPLLTATDTDYLPALYLYGPNPSLMDEPMPFALPEPRPDTTVELVAPSDMSMIVDEQAPPNVLDPRASLPNLWVPEPRPEDFRDMAMDLDALADQGIMASDTDFDLC
jgi:hypothetical protein